MWTNAGGHWHHDARPSRTPEGAVIVEDIYVKPKPKRKRQKKVKPVSEAAGIERPDEATEPQS